MDMLDPHTLDQIAKAVARELNFDQKFDAIDERFNAMDRKFDAIDERFDAMDKKVGPMGEKVVAIEEMLIRNTIDIAQMRFVDFPALEKKVADGFAEHDEKLQQVYGYLSEKLEDHDQKFNIIIKMFSPVREDIHHLDVRVTKLEKAAAKN